MVKVLRSLEYRTIAPGVQWDPQYTATTGKAESPTGGAALP